MKNKVLILTMCALLSACNTDIKEALGLNHKGPDEFQVVSRPPLTIPPEFNLRPPLNETDNVSRVPASDQAHNQVLGTKPVSNNLDSVSSGDLPNGADAQLLKNAGATSADPTIRQKILDDRNNGLPNQNSPYLLGGDKADTQVDSAKEAERLKENKAENKPATQGDTPVVAPKGNGILGDIF